MLAEDLGKDRSDRLGRCLVALRQTKSEAAATMQVLLRKGQELASPSFAAGILAAEGVGASFEPAHTKPFGLHG